MAWELPKTLHGGWPTLADSSRFKLYGEMRAGINARHLKALTINSSGRDSSYFSLSRRFLTPPARLRVVDVEGGEV